MTTKPLLCLVTNRAQLAEAVGRPLTDASGLLLRQIEGAVAGGVDLVQIREPDLEGRDLVRLVRDAVAIAAHSATRVVVNARVDVAIAAGAAGVHLRESSMTATQVRRIAPQCIVGRSVHSTQRAAEAGPVDYLIAGTLFPTPSKADASETLGPEGLAAIVRAASGVPVLAIGGITATTIRQVRATGAAGVAAIGAFIPSDRDADLVQAVEKSAQTLRFAFDTASAVS